MSSIREAIDGRNDVIRRVLAQPMARRAVLAVLCGVVFFSHLGGPALWDPDEGRHAEIAREMLQSGNWLTPTFNFAPYHDKPVFIYWLLSAAMRVFGPHEWALRLPSALAAVAGVAATVWWGGRFLGPPVGILAGLILATAGMYVAVGRYVLIDMTFAFWIVLAYLLASAWFLEGRTRRRPAWLFYVPLAIATLAKGPVGIVLAVLIFTPFLWGRKVCWRELQPVRGLCILAALTGSWYLAAAIAAPDYIVDFLWSHNVGRFASARTGHGMNAFAYLYLLPLSFLPWSAYLPAAALHARRHARTGLSRPIEFCALWVGVTVVFFSVSKAKLPTYMLPVFVPLSLLLAAALRPALVREPLPSDEASAHRIAVGSIVLLLVLITAAVTVFLHRVAPGKAVYAVAMLLPLAVILWGWSAQRNGRFDQALLSVTGATALLVVVFYGAIAPHFDDTLSLVNAGKLVRRLPPDATVASYRAKTNSFLFYGRRHVSRAADLVDATRHLSAGEAAALLTKQRFLPTLACALSRPVFVWWEGEGNKALIVNRSPSVYGAQKGRALRVPERTSACAVLSEKVGAATMQRREEVK